MRWSLLPIVIVALVLAIYGSRQGATPSSGPTTRPEASAAPVGEPSSVNAIELSLSLYVVHQQPQAGGTGSPPQERFSSIRTEDELTLLAQSIQEIWKNAGIVFEPVTVRTIEVPSDVVVSLRELDCQPFLQLAGQEFDIPDTAQINGFYLADLGPVNGFTPRSTNVFFVTDEPSVHDERVSSHEIGHILGLDHASQDQNRLMFSGTNGMDLTTQEIETARSAALSLGGRSTTESSVEEPTSGVVQVHNQGGSMEGHTPRGFAGSGIGLFVGDNLNPGFPDGDGVQVFLTFDLSSDLLEPSQVFLTSEALQVDGTPFEDLGPLLIEPVRYETFGPHLFDLDAVGVTTECLRPSEHTISCDVTGSTVEAMNNQQASIQFRLYFERPGDSDQSQDLAKFFRSDSNTNEAGLFTLEFQP